MELDKDFFSFRYLQLELGLAVLIDMFFLLFFFSVKILDEPVLLYRGAVQISHKFGVWLGKPRSDGCKLHLQLMPILYTTVQVTVHLFKARILGVFPFIMNSG